MLPRLPSEPVPFAWFFTVDGCGDLDGDLIGRCRHRAGARVLRRDNSLSLSCGLPRKAGLSG